MGKKKKAEDDAPKMSVADAGTKGGNRNSPLQRQTRQRNMLKALARRWPNSATIAAKIKELDGK